MTLVECTKFITERRATINTLEEMRQENITQRAAEYARQVDLIVCQELISELGVVAQQETNDVIEELVTQGVQAVFGDEHGFQMENVIQRNKPETEFYVVNRGHRRHLRDESGGGVIDVIALCLRVVVWAISNNRSAPIIILDEPLKFLDGERQVNAGLMIQRLSAMLGIQFIIVTHEDQLIAAADVLYKTSKPGKITVLELLKDGEQDERS